ncbi:Uncharacterised protein [Vibrio cholerae]|nr:Uncharacterised protein [Vibrio cholerae]
MCLPKAKPRWNGCTVSTKPRRRAAVQHEWRCRISVSSGKITS